MRRDSDWEAWLDGHNDSLHAYGSPMYDLASEAEGVDIWSNLFALDLKAIDALYAGV